jgi:hypothetical protein
MADKKYVAKNMAAEGDGVNKHQERREQFGIEQVGIILILILINNDFMHFNIIFVT